MRKQTQRIDLSFKGELHWFSVSKYETQEQLHIALHGNGISEFVPDTDAYTDTWSVRESLENGLGDRNCAGHIYLPVDVGLDILAHEATHMALGILSRHGKRNLPVTTNKAPEVEEHFCSLVGFITDELAQTYKKGGL